MNLNDTIRRYPRTSLEAWPERHPYAIERCRPVRAVIMDLALAAAIGIGLGLVVALSL
jgi:hypothetical protein